MTLEQLDLPTPAPSRFDADNLDRLNRQTAAVLAFMRDGKPRTIAEVAEAVGCGENSASARIRELRTHGFVVTRHKTATRGLYLYSVEEGRDA